MDMALIALSLGAYKATGDPLTRLAAIVSAAAFPVYILLEILVGWPSAAVSETYGIIIIDAAVILLTVNYTRRAAAPRTGSQATL